MNDKLAVACLTVVALWGAVAMQASVESYVVGLTIRGGGRCPFVVWAVVPDSPAQRAGIVVGDHLVAIDGVPTLDMSPAAASRRIQSGTAGVVGLTVSRGDRQLEVRIAREPRDVVVARTGNRVCRDIVVPKDTTDDEVSAMLAFDGSRVVARVFPMHYPSNQACFSGGFEIFVLKDPAEVAVGGIEPGPAARAGLHWGDRILDMNGIVVAGKTAAELEALFCRQRPGRLELLVQRTGEKRRVAFVLEKTADLLRTNGLRVVGGALVPTGVSDEDAGCLNAP